MNTNQSHLQNLSGMSLGLQLQQEALNFIFFVIIKVRKNIFPQFPIQDFLISLLGRELERLDYIDKQAKKDDLDREFEERRQERKEAEEEKTAKKRQKRQRQKERKRAKMDKVILVYIFLILAKLQI